MVGAKPGDSNAMTGYQVDDFTCTVLQIVMLLDYKYIVDIMGKKSALAYFSLKGVVRNTHF